MRKKILIMLMLLVSIVSNAQSNIWVSGNVYTEEDGKQSVVPFATICVSEMTENNEICYYTVSGVKGNYNIKPYNYTKQYSYVISAPGFKTKVFNLKAIPERLNGKPFLGNRTVNIKLEHDSVTQKIEHKVYSLSELKKLGNGKTIIDALGLIPEIKKENNEWIDKESDEGICFFLNGGYVTNELYAKFQVLPMELIADVEYFKIPKGGSYGAATNVHLSVGQSAKTPDYILEESDLIF